jgi:hypothetical protein
VKFEPDTGFNAVDLSWEKAAFSALFSSTDQSSAKSILSDIMSPFICTAQWLGKPTSLERFLENAIEAIDTYVRLRNWEAKFDRKRAGPLLKDATKAIERARSRITEIQQWQELSNYLQMLERDLIGSRAVEQSHTGSKTIASTKEQGLSSLQQIGTLLVKLQPVLEVAIKQITFAPGDAQRDIVAQTFTDEMAAAWCCGTGRVPTVARKSTRTRNPSPFLQLLTAINSKILREQHRSNNNFLEYAIKSKKHLEALYI